MPLELFKEKPLFQIKRTIAVAAGKGGVGKSTVAVNLALALKKKGEKVGILDADLYGPSLGRMLPDERLAKEEEGIIHPAYSHGLHTLSIAHFRPAYQALSVRAPIANGMIAQFLSKTAWGELDTLIIDFPPGTGDIQMTLAQKGHLTGALMVSTPQDLSVMDVRKAIYLFEQTQVPILGIVENMSFWKLPNGQMTYPFGEGGAERLAQECGIAFLGKIPFDPLYGICADQGLSIFEEMPELGELFLQLAGKLACIS